VALLRAEAGRSAAPPADLPTAHPAEEAFRAAMDDDFNTARATGVLFDLAREGNRLLQEARRSSQPPQASVIALEETATLLRRLGSVLTIDFAAASADVAAASAVTLTRSVEEALHELQTLLAAEPPHPADLETRLTAVVRELLALREAARKKKAWAESDGIRQTLAASGFRVDDTRTACHAVSDFPTERGLPAVNVSLVKG
jgi:cysteinyl-tRNA synthetase